VRFLQNPRRSALLAATALALLGAAAFAAPSALAQAPEETILVPAGPFLMGTPTDRLLAPEDEKPQHTVMLPAFRINRVEVTNARYARFLQAIRKSHPPTCHSGEVEGKDHTPDAKLWNDPEWNAPEKPVVGVDWFDAYAYCAWAGERLPTEAEWEKAARGEDGRRYSWGNLAPGSGRLGNFADESAKRLNPKWGIVPGYDDGFAHTAPVGSFPAGASPYGVQDMIGNAWEWVNDWYSETVYTTEPVASPRGPGTGEKRVLRGGSWDSTPNFLRTALRYSHFPGYRSNSFGFRCAREAPGGTAPAPTPGR
jgi:formylglycine-generating enzyme required for sulfatase activity